MKAANKVLTLVGGIFTLVGCFIFIAFLANIEVFGAMAFFPLLFVVLGVAFIVPAILQRHRNKAIIRNGRRFPAKIYKYVEDTSVLVNDAYPINTVVHYFDETGTEREVILDTGFARGSNEYPLGMTIDIYEYNGKYGWNKGSVCNETIPGEAELLDDKPVNTVGMETIAITCPSCGAPFSGVKGYVSTCPYCGKRI